MACGRLYSQFRPYARNGIKQSLRGAHPLDLRRKEASHQAALYHDPRDRNDLQRRPRDLTHMHAGNKRINQHSANARLSDPIH